MSDWLPVCISVSNNTVELQWLEHLWYFENMFEAAVVRANEVNDSARSVGSIGIFFSNVFHMKVCCVFSLESPHRCDSNEYTQYTSINMINKIIQNYSKCNNVCRYGKFS